MINLLARLFPKSVDAIWADGYAIATRGYEQDKQRLANAIRDLNNADWDFPKGTRREEAAKVMIEQAAQMVESFK